MDPDPQSFVPDTSGRRALDEDAIAKALKAATDALQLRQRYLATLDNLPFQVWLKDVDGRYLAVNPPLYGGQCIRWAADYQQVEIKLRYAQGWAWSQPMAVKGRPKRLDTTGAEVLSPTLVLHGTGVRCTARYR